MLTDEGLDALEKIVGGHVGPDRVPGLVALIANDDQIHQVAAGQLAVGGPPVASDSLWRIASTTKPLTAITTLVLVDEGLVDLDEPVERLLPEMADRRVLTRMDDPLADTVPAERAITVRELLTFTFGFGMAAEMFASPEPWPVVAAYARLGTFGPPTLVLGDTAFWTDQPTRLATAYRPGPDGLEVTDPSDGAWSRPPRLPNAAAGLVSTAADLLEVARMLLRGGSPVLSPAAVTELTRSQVSADQIRGAEIFLGERSWALGQAVQVGGERMGAFGWDGGLGTSWLVDPARDLVVIVLTQRQFDDPRLPAVHRDIQDAAYAAWRP